MRLMKSASKQKVNDMHVTVENFYNFAPICYFRDMKLAKHDECFHGGKEFKFAN